MSQTIIQQTHTLPLEMALAAMEDAAAAGDYQKAKDAAQLAHESGLMKYGGPSLALFLIAQDGPANTEAMRTACDLIKDSLDSLKKIAADTAAANDK